MREVERYIYRVVCLNTLMDTDGQVTRHWHNDYTWWEAARGRINLSVKWKQSDSEIRPYFFGDQSLGMAVRRTGVG